MATDVLAPTSFPTPAFRRLQRGTRYSPVVADNYADSSSSGSQAPPPSLYHLDSAFQLQEYIAQLVKRDPEDIDAIVKLPGSGQQSGDQNLLGQEIQEVDVNCWIYEHLRRLAQDLTFPLITTLQEQCTRQTCPEMKAGEWLYLCVAHGNGGAMEQCCAIDYILHTLDSATSLLNSSRTFPSRIAIPAASTKHFSSLARRLSRIFAHAYFHHRELFEEAEAQNALYERFLGLVREFDLVPAEYLVIDWEGRPARKSKSMPNPQGEASTHLRPEDETGSEMEHSRQILSRNADQQRSRGEGSLSASADDSGLTASPSGGLGRRRTDTMYMTGEMLTALDDVLSGGNEGSIPFPGSEEYLHRGSEQEQEIPLEQSIDVPESSQESGESEMVESVVVDPFGDDAEAITVNDTGPEVAAIKDEVVILGDDTNVPDVEDVVVPVAAESEPAAIQLSAPESEEDPWPDVEVLEKDAAEAIAEGQIREDIVAEPVPSAATTSDDESPANSTADLQEGSSENGVDPEKSKPADVDVIEKMLGDLEIARNANLEAATASANTDAPAE